MNLICQGEVKYFTCLYPQEKKALKGDRGNLVKSDPTFQLWCNDVTKEFQLKVCDIKAESMYSATVKQHADIYFLKDGALQLQNGLQLLLQHITSNTLLDRGDRSPRDPGANYSNQGLPLQIDSLEAWIKASKVTASFLNENYSITTIRQKNTNVAMPRINIEVEKNATRLHIGVEIDWVKTVIEDNENSLKIDIPWQECGHLLSAINNGILKIK